MRFDLTDDQRAVRDAIDELCRARWDPATMRRHLRGEDDGSGLWRELASAGWTGAAIAEQYGGQGLGTVELSLVNEGLGRALAPSSFFGNMAAGLLVEMAGSQEQKQQWLPGFAAGESRGAIGMLKPDGTALAFDAEGAAAVVLVGDGRAMIASSADCRSEAIDGVDLTRRLSRLRVSESDELSGDVAAAVDRLEVALSAELVGVANRAMDLAVDHARTRQQFGRPIGAYQAVSHRCADMLIDVESARSAVLGAAWTADHDAETLPFAASVAKVAAAQGAWRVTAASLQVHGGIGFTWEHDCHLLLRRAAASSRLLGSVDFHLDRLSRLRGLGPVGEAVSA
ncbi:MAG: acyl-CoA/acyl-ACP dehydrogenase [Candidatus Dormibacteraeota bacterium]|uniref:Acyl-CoA/acyl-ACP dehydrogenase n=1 Tax=Candidatus Aeolococcus gillhamiae TaxID=3127015 RepID=A0A934N319_9BACT|nr:acyl-CoA/acyl-ACP dehydrogenase [Candidatus Dormibacteraeota bacterium]